MRLVNPVSITSKTSNSKGQNFRVRAALKAAEIHWGAITSLREYAQCPANHRSKYHVFSCRFLARGGRCIAQRAIGRGGEPRARCAGRASRSPRLRDLSLASVRAPRNAALWSGVRFPHVPLNAIRMPGYTFVPGVGILGESCDLPTSACPNEYRETK